MENKIKTFLLFNYLIFLFCSCTATSTSLSAYNNWGNAYSDKGQYDRAIQDCTKVIEIAPRYADAYNNRGFVYLVKLGDKKKGCSDWKRACELGDCKDDDLAIMRGYCQ